MNALRPRWPAGRPEGDIERANACLLGEAAEQAQRDLIDDVHAAARAVALYLHFRGEGAQHQTAAVVALCAFAHLPLPQDHRAEGFDSAQNGHFFLVEADDDL